MLGGIIYVLDTYDSGYRVDHGQSKDVTIASASGQCHKVTNNHPSNDYFIPTKTQAEWDAFVAHLPPGASVGSCCTSHDHQACYDNDVYWYDSCNNREEKAQECGAAGCSGGSCVTTGTWVVVGGGMCTSGRTAMWAVLYIGNR